MSGDVYMGLFALISVLSIASLTFATSIFAGAKSKFVAQFRAAIKRGQKDSDILDIIPAANALVVPLRRIGIFIPWAVSFAAAIAANNSLISDMDDAVLERLKLSCEILMCVSTIVSIFIALQLYTNPNNTKHSFG